MKLTDFDFRIWDGEKYLEHKIYNNNENENEYIAVTCNVDSEHYIFTILHGVSRDYYGGDYDEYFKVKDYVSYDYQYDYEIELWTGFCDINGNKIYENDILENKNLEEIYHITRDDANKMFKIAIYEKESNGELYRRKAEPDISFLKSFKSEKNIEVIGNIHENEELLK